ncbi:MAG: hypothetical protein HYX28_04520 [Candidatus Koribacter versatilis]|uniref:DUF91 domain-containing protein n=1 Tax=Candidatus Korobacter versatilis TaxID=658062 RepID=A0A932A7B0_9BACT|nr:hypothetical protein [Candidatus Koribacter versatilis]
MSPEALARAIQDFLGEAPSAVVREEGEITFDFSSARYSVSSEHGKCVLHLWSGERNAVRRVVDAEQKDRVLRLQVQRFGRGQPTKLEICRDRDQRTPTAKKAARTAYKRLLERVLAKSFPDANVEKLTSAMDLEQSFGPIYTRGLLRRGNSAFAVLGVNASETQASVDAALTFGLLWLDHCRYRDARRVVEGLQLFVPPRTSAIVRERMAHLNHAAAKFALYELDERELALAVVDCRDRGNVATRLVRAPDERAARERFAAQTARVRAIVPDAEAVVLNGTEMAYRLHGLEFAHARIAALPGSFRNAAELSFGPPPQETLLTDDTGADFERFARMLAAARVSHADRTNPLYRMHPERWLESLVSRNLAQLDARLLSAPVYSQVPAFSASDRAMIDVLGVTRESRLAVIELKADEDIHLPLQGIDYWARVEWHHQRGEFKQFGYFAGVELSPAPPLLLLVAPALRVHPATDTLLRYISPEIDCELLGIDERWREELRVVFRKRSRSQGAD